MLDALRSLFGVASESPANDGARELHLAAAALLLEVSYADFEMREEELQEVAASLKRTFGFTVAETTQLLELATASHDQHHSMHPFVRQINERFSPVQKSLLMEDMWRIAFADKHLDKYEEHRIRKIADLLYIPHSEFIRTKLKVQESVGQ